METLDQVIARALHTETVSMQAELDKTASRSAVLLEQKTDLEVQLEVINAAIESQNQQVKGLASLIEGLGIEAEARSSKGIVSGRIDSELARLK